MTPSEFVAWINRNAARVTHYEKGGDGSGDGGCDCIGLIIGAWRMSGNMVFESEVWIKPETPVAGE